MKLNTLYVTDVAQICTLFGIQTQRLKTKSMVDMDIIVGQIFTWMEYLSKSQISYRPKQEYAGYSFKIQHDTLKKDWQTQKNMSNMLTDEHNYEYCIIYFLNVNGIFLALTTGFYHQTKNPYWKIGQISGGLIKKILML